MTNVMLYSYCFTIISPTVSSFCREKKISFEEKRLEKSGWLENDPKSVAKVQFKCV